jgi:type II secretory pathway pseudopilin PulG
MKKLNNKGFSLIELLIAFSAITVLSIAIFRTIISIQKRQQTNIAYNDYIVLQSSINSLIQKDLVNKIVEAVEYCGNNCYKIKYQNEATQKTLSINRKDNTITYGLTKLKLPKTYSFYRDIENKEEKFTTVEEDRYDSLIMFRIPIESTVLEQNLDLIYIYQYDSRLNPVRSTI